MIITSSSKNKLLLGDNNKALNKRVLSTTNLDNSVLVIDLYYYSSLINSKLRYNSSFGRNWASLTGGGDRILALQAINSVFEPIMKLKRLISVESIVVLCNTPTKMTPVERELLKLFTSVMAFYIPTTKEKIVSTLYSLATADKKQYLVMSDNLEFWLICNKKSKIHYCTVIKNNAVRIYSEKFGLEYLSSLIQSNKLVNKLRLNKIKYVNLQYLFLLLLYTKFKHTKVNEDFDMSGKGWLGSKGKALRLLSDSHKEISYCFLTKPDMVDLFITSSTTHFVLNLSRLLKITQFDVKLMSGFSGYYQIHSVKFIDITRIPAGKPSYKLVEGSKLLQHKGIQPRIQNNSKKQLPKKELVSDIKDMETSLAVSEILRSLSW